MNDSCMHIIGEDYADFLFEYESDEKLLENLYQASCIHNIDGKNLVIHVNTERIDRYDMDTFGYDAYPKCYGLDDVSAVDTSGIARLRNVSNSSMRGRNVLVGFVDTGIDYRNNAFQYDDGTTRIVSIWDQTDYEGNCPEEMMYGSEYTKEDIDTALRCEDPLSIVPVTDESGHGTFLAGMAVGKSDARSGFTGIATDSEIVVVKLKQAKKITRSFFRVPEDAVCFQENDIMNGVKYLVDTARKCGKSIVICVALGTNQGGHEGRVMLSSYLSYIGGFVGVCVVVAAGNEGNRWHHFYGQIAPQDGYQTMDLKVGENENDFSLEIWGAAPYTYSIDILSPTGEYIPRIPARLGENREIRFLFEDTYLVVDYRLVESRVGDQLILLRFENPAAGIWSIRVYGTDTTARAGFHAWLPLSGFIGEETVFLRPDQFTTITAPGNADTPITVTAYNHLNENLFSNASRGFTRTGEFKPDFAAPGVNIFGVLPENQYGIRSGTSVAAAYVSGIAATLFELQVEFGAEHVLNTIEIKHLLIRGAKRYPQRNYPSEEWGYGILDVYRSIERLRE